MQAIFETLFDTVYLVSVITMGAIMVKGSKGSLYFRLFGIMSMILGIGDAFHLIPRAYALNTAGLAANVVPLGVGKFVTSVTMTVFYVLLYALYKMKSEAVRNKPMDLTIYGLGALRIALCLLPGNQWLSVQPSLAYGIARNVPFAIMGLLIIQMTARFGKAGHPEYLKLAYAVALSFLFYIPVVLFSGSYPLIGMLMIPKTMAYVYIVWVGFRAFRERSLTLKTLGASKESKTA